MTDLGRSVRVVRVRGDGSVQSWSGLTKTQAEVRLRADSQVVLTKETERFMKFMDGQNKVRKDSRYVPRIFNPNRTEQTQSIPRHQNVHNDSSANVFNSYVENRQQNKKVELHSIGNLSPKKPSQTISYFGISSPFISPSFPPQRGEYKLQEDTRHPPRLTEQLFMEREPTTGDGSATQFNTLQTSSPLFTRPAEKGGRSPSFSPSPTFGLPSPISPAQGRDSHLQVTTNARIDEDGYLDSFIESRIKQIVDEALPREEDKAVVKRKSVFNAPFKQSKMTEFYKEKKKTVKQRNVDSSLFREIDEVFDLVVSEENLSQLWSMLKHCTEISMVITFQEGFTQLRDTSLLGDNFGSAQSVILRLEGNTEEEEETVAHVRIDLWKISLPRKIKQFFWQEILFHSQARKLIYDGKAFLKCVMSIYQDQVGEIQTEQVHLIDPLVGCWLLQPDRPPSSFLDCLKILGQDMEVKPDSSLGSCQTATIDLQVLSRLGKILFRKLNSFQLWDVFYQLEMKLVPHLVMMERNGVCLNESRLHDLGNCLDRQLAILKEEAHKAAGKQFNLSSPMQVRVILFDELKLDTITDIKVGKTAGGVKSTCETVLQALTSCHPLPGLILEHRQIMKYKTTYVDGFFNYSQYGRLFTCWDQLAAATGRLTSVSPNIQGIPKGEIQVGGENVNLRSAIVSSEGRIFLCADFEQIELRIYAALSLDPGLVTATKESGDIFRRLAAMWLEKDQCLVTENDRERTKRLVYALMYGAGKSRLSDILSMTLEQAGTIMTSFYKKFSTLRIFNQRVIGLAEKNGFLTTLLGRRRYFPGIRSNNLGVKSQSQRSAFNFLIQGSAADIAKMGLLAAQHRLKEAKLETSLVMMVHDELVWEVKPAQLAEAAAIVQNTLQNTQAFTLLQGRSEFKVSLPVKVSWGGSLGNLEIVEECNRVGR